MVRARSHRRRLTERGLALPALALLACGPRWSEEGAAGGSGTSEHGSSDGLDATAGEASTSTSEGEACPQSDLPPPFCHRFVAYPAEVPLDGVLSSVVDGVRPLVSFAPTASRLRLLDPLDPTHVLLEGPPVTEPAPGARMHSGDFDGDGVTDLAYLSWRDGAELFDGASLDHWTTAPPPVESATVVGVVDVDGDGASELVWVAFDDTTRYGLVFHTSGASGDDFVLEQSEPEGIQCPFDETFQGDFDGDGRQDLLMAMTEDCDDYLEAFGLPRQLITLLAAPEPSSEMRFVLSPQPEWQHHVTVANLDADPNDELVLERDAETIVVMDWADEGFVEQERLSLPSGYLNSSAYFTSCGNFADSGAVGGCFTYALLPDDPAFDPTSDPRPVGALFLAGVTPQFMETSTRDHYPAVDFDGSGVADFLAELGGQPGVFVSAWQ